MHGTSPLGITKAPHGKNFYITWYRWPKGRVFNAMQGVDSEQNLTIAHCACILLVVAAFCRTEDKMNFHTRLLRDHKEEYEEYTAALVTYKLACKEFTKIRQKYKYSTEAKERLLYYEARDRYGLACRAYNVARAKWEQLVVKVRMQADYGDTLGLDLSRVLGVKIPLSVADLKKANDERRIEESFKPGELERLQSEIRQAYSANRPTRLNFMSRDDDESEKDKTAGDFEPLPPTE